MIMLGGLEERITGKREHLSRSLGRAVDLRHYEKAFELLSAGASPNSAVESSGERVLAVCLRRYIGDQDQKALPLARKLLERGADPNSETHSTDSMTLLNASVQSAFFSAAYAVKAVRMLLAFGADPNLPNRSDGATPLLKLAELRTDHQNDSGLAELATELIEAGADPLFFLNGSFLADETVESVKKAVYEAIVTKMAKNVLPDE